MAGMNRLAGIRCAFVLALLLEISDAAGSSWRRINFPADATVPESVEGARVRALQNELPNLRAVLFLGFQNYSTGLTEWWWTNDIDANPVAWRNLGTSMPPYAFPPGEYDSGSLSASGAKLYFIGGHGGVVAYSKE